LVEEKSSIKVYLFAGEYLRMPEQQLFFKWGNTDLNLSSLKHRGQSTSLDRRFKECQ
jgi:hypothetical protein